MIQTLLPSAMQSSSSVTRQTSRQQPPRASADASTFPYSAAHFDPSHDPTLSLQVIVDPSPNSRAYCTGEQVSGTVTIYRRTPVSPNEFEVPIIALLRSLSVRVSVESRTLFWILVDEKQNGSINSLRGREKKVKEPEPVRWSLQHEWARSSVSLVSLISNGDMDVEPDEDGDELSFRFHFVLPSLVSFDEWNPFQGANRERHRELRPSPPTSRDSPDASVEWICEAILDLRGPSRSNLPSPIATRTPVDSDAQSLSAQSFESTSSFSNDLLRPLIDTRGFLASKAS